MKTKKQIEESIKSLEWLKFNIVGTKEPKKNTFEYAAKVYLENAITLLKDQESDEILDIIVKHSVNIERVKNCSTFEQYNLGKPTKDRRLTETEFNKIKEASEKWVKQS